MTVSTYLGNKLLDHVLRGVAYAAPTNIYVSLHTASPGLNGANEATLGAWPAYVRRHTANGGAIGTGFVVADAKVTANAVQLLWPAMDGAAPITLTHFGVWDAPTGGNFLFGDPLSASKTLGPTDEMVENVGACAVTVT
jgi:hypothetical protein